MKHILIALLGAFLLGTSGFALGVTYQGDFIPLRDKVGDAGRCNALDINTGRLVLAWPKNAQGRCYLRDNTWGHVLASLGNMKDALGSNLSAYVP